MDKYIIAIGGGELRQKETLEIDRQIAEMAKLRAGDKRAVALFIGTASHDFMPYYNTFHKTYTGELGLKTDCALTVFKEIDYEKLKGKFQKADMIYVGGGDTVFMLEKWKQTGLDKLILDAYERGVIIAGLSAGAICWFERMFTDSFMISGESNEYQIHPALGLLKGGACPHYNERADDFKSYAGKEKSGKWILIENLACAVFKNGQLDKTLSAGGKVFEVEI
ncbi:MAG: Type 1 glutamine amidotransferase-like domain-containing protein [Clostridia bacterium]|nr:Type 1 glutamine amidotransferase-like domain-containing protein [Clostridia bacterium]